MELMASLKKSMFCFIYTIQNRFGNEREQFRKAICAFIKQCDKLSESNDARIQKALFTFAKDVVLKKGKKTNASQIPVQSPEEGSNTEEVGQVRLEDLQKTKVSESSYK